MKTFSMFIAVVTIVLLHLGCASDEDKTSFENPVTLQTPAGLNAAPLGDDVVLENMYEAETAILADKTHVQVVTVIEGTGRVTLEARFRGVRDLGLGFPVYECELVDDAAEAIGGIAQGMSGSPVGPPGRVMGALAYGDYYSKAPTRFWVTAIDAMEASMTHQTFGDLRNAEPAPAAPSGVNSMYTPVKTPLMITGLQPHRLEQLNSRLQGSRYEFLQFIAAVNGAPGAPQIETTNLKAGDMIGAAVATGDVVNAIGFGTVTQVYDDGTFVAFGHPFNGNGKAAMPVYRAVVNGIVPNLQASYKSVAAYGNPIGTITKDLVPAIVGELGVVPEMIPVKIAYDAGSGESIEKHHEVAYGQETFIPTVVWITMDALRQEISPRTVNTTVALHFKETETTFTRSFRSATLDGSFDGAFQIDAVISNFTRILTNEAGKATLKEVSITIKDTPQIMRAAIHEVIVPEEIIPGESATFTIVLLPHWSATKNDRTIQKEVTIDIPENFPEGNARLQVAAQYQEGDIFLLGFDDFDFGFDDFEEIPLPENLDELIKQKEAELIDPGSILIRLTPPDDFGFDLDFDFEIPDFDFEIPEPDDIEMPEVPPVDDLSPLDDLPSLEDLEPAEPIEIEIIIEDFIVTGSKLISVDITVPNAEDDVPPDNPEDPILNLPNDE